MRTFIWIALALMAGQSPTGYSVNAVNSPASLTSVLGLCTTCTIVINSTVTASSNASIPVTTTLQFSQGGSLSVNTGVTVNFQGGAIIAGTYQVFSGVGSVTNLNPIEPEWFGSITTAATFTAAIGACPSAACKIVLQGGNTRYNSPYNDATPLSNSNIEFSGGGMPFPNSSSTPTSLVGGTIIYPAMTWSGNYLNIHDLGVDGGSGTTGTAGDVFNLVSTGGSTAAAGLMASIHNIVALGTSTTAAFHAFKVEGYDQVVVDNVYTFRNIDGVVAKTTNSRFSNLHGQGHMLACIYPKSNTYAPSQNNVFTNWTCKPEVGGDTEYGLLIQGQGQPVVGLSASNGTCGPILSCVNLSGDSTSAGIIEGTSISNTTTNGVTSQAFTMTGFVANVTIDGASLFNTGDWTVLAVGSAPNVSGVVFSNISADATSGAGCLNLPNTGSIVLGSPSLTQSVCPNVVQPTPVYTLTIPGITVPLTQNADVTTWQWTPQYPGRVVAIDTVATTAPTCAGQVPVLAVYDATSASLGTTQVRTIFVSGQTAYAVGTGILIFAAGDAITLRETQNASGCAVAPIVNLVIQYQAR